MDTDKPKRRKTGGRQKGTPNRITGQLREMVLGALDDAGGQAYLAQQARETPSAFLALLGKVLPLQVTGEGGGPVIMRAADLADDALAAIASGKQG